jgi:hypothetical protein
MLGLPFSAVAEGDFFVYGLVVQEFRGLDVW